MTREEMEELKGLAASMGLYDDKHPCKRAVILGKAIKALEQESETGHWEWLTEDKYRCSNCNHETRVDECLNKPMYDFCPFCRAKMDEPQKSEGEG